MSRVDEIFLEVKSLLQKGSDEFLKVIDSIKKEMAEEDILSQPTIKKVFWVEHMKPEKAKNEILQAIDDYTKDDSPYIISLKNLSSELESGKDSKLAATWITQPIQWLSGLQSHGCIYLHNSSPELKEINKKLSDLSLEFYDLEG